MRCGPARMGLVRAYEKDAMVVELHGVQDKERKLHKERREGPRAGGGVASDRTLPVLE